MSRFAEVIVLARRAEDVMAPLTTSDPSRAWPQPFIEIDDAIFSGAGFEFGSDECYMWINQFYRNNWGGLLAYLESLPWPRPETVQVLIHDEGDDCFGLWMIYDGKLTEVPLPRTCREEYASSITGVLFREDRAPE
ncbi:hypothetical protein IRT45_05050 [Nocardia sp. BSTN01]|nr:hypothetical protein [Nocardia sp. BSTN01]MBF4996521.1 hypothetical protein [Nocardia sp. BSTN01]PSR68793.1 hypothetical protein C8258_08870 [Nocardia sp. MDA0666]